MTEHSKTGTFSRCFRCQSGCIHLACGNVTLTLTPVEFLILAEAILAMRHQLKEESRRAREESAQVHAGSLFGATVVEVVLAAGLIGIFIDSFAEKQLQKWWSVPGGTVSSDFHADHLDCRV